MESRPESDPLDALKSVAVEANRRRRRNSLIMTMIILNGFMSFVASAGVLAIYLHQSDRDHKASVSKKVEDAVRDRRVADVYASANDTNAVVHRLEGSPPPPPISATTTTTVRRAVARRSTSTTSRAVVPSSLPSTDGSGPPTTGAAAPSQPPQTTSTTRPCPTVTVPLAGNCIGGP